MEECECVAGSAFEILCEATAAIEPGECALDDPAARQNDEALGGVRALDDLDIKFLHLFGDGFLEDRPLIAAIGEEFAQERVEAKQGRKYQNAAIAVLDISRMNDRMHQQALGVDENMPFLALDLFACIVAIRVNAGPPFSALFTLWESIMHAVGLASCSSLERHWTYKA